MVEIVVGRIEGIIKFRISCLRPLGCSKAQGKEKLRGVAGISGKFWSRQKMAVSSFFGKRAREFVLEME